MSISEDTQSSIQQTFERLSSSAASLNKATDSLNAAVRKLDAALGKLSLGIESWVYFDGYEDVPFRSSDFLGYCKWNGKWTICIRTAMENLATQEDDEDRSYQWTFFDAPRELRV